MKQTTKNILGVAAIVLLSSGVAGLTTYKMLNKEKPAAFSELFQQNPNNLRLAAYNATDAQPVDLTQAAENSVHAVVHIRAKQLSKTQTVQGMPDIFDFFFGDGRGQQRQIQTQPRVGFGSDVIISKDGYIVTNAHVVDGAQSISVVLPDSYNDTSSKSDDSKSSSDSSSDDDEDNLTYTATLVGKDTQTDIAVLKIDAKGLTAAEFGTSADLQVGEASIVIGNPLGFSLANSVTAGIISATDRTLTVEDRTMNLIQTDASINSGNSGGPLINAYGQVIGITSAKVSSSVGEGLGFAIPIDEALPIVEDLMKNGYVTGRPSLGISGTDITSAYSSYYGIPQGFLVKSVTKGSGSEKAGIQENDIVIGINGTVISNISELNEIKNKCKVGDTVQLTIYRNKKMINVDVVLGESTEDTSESNDNDQNNNNNNNNNNDDYNGYYGNGLGGYDYGYGF